MICDLVEEQRLADLLGEMASFACPAHDLSLMLRLPVVASEAIRESPCPQVRALRMVGIPQFVISRKVPARHDNRIAFDRLFMHDPRNGTSYSPPLGRASQTLRYVYDGS
jgi:hypothetical protein